MSEGTRVIAAQQGFGTPCRNHGSGELIADLSCKTSDICQ
jgi:hypothetical protein